MHIFMTTESCECSPVYDIKLLLLAAHVILGFYEIRRPSKNLNPIKVI
jgi:hypothetical protein